MDGGTSGRIQKIDQKKATRWSPFIFVEKIFTEDLVPSYSSPIFAVCTWRFVEILDQARQAWQRSWDIIME